MFARSERRVWLPAENGIGRKCDFRVYEGRGRFGNRFQSWKTLQEMSDSGYRGWLRITGREASSEFKVNEVERVNLMPTLQRLIAKGARLDDLVFGEVPSPDNPRVLNFEAHLSERHVELDWGTGQKPLRDDLNERHQRPVHGLEASMILKHFLAEEHDLLEDVWLHYPLAVVEASVWRRPVGVLQKRMVIWEARQY